jgi:hypothetical protein
MAHRAVLVYHISGMRLVALEAFRNIPVGLVACGAEEFRMEAGMVFRLFSLLWVTGEAWCGQVCGKFHLEGGMRVGMTGVAAADLIVRFAGVA